MRISAWLMMLMAVATTAGCGGDGLERAQITGVVTVEGTPLSDASVQFLPLEGTPGEGALGSSDAEGKFEVISSRRSDEGIPPGEYKVRVSRLQDADGSPIPATAPQADYPDAVESVPVPYSTAESPLKVVISPEGGEVKVEIPVALRKGKR
ncbi:MAG: carboxypeptidase-like regulatory domain-containing protein [Planctomycetaceae bacterium]